MNIKRRELDPAQYICHAKRGRIKRVQLILRPLPYTIHGLERATTPKLGVRPHTLPSFQHRSTFPKVHSRAMVSVP